MEIIVKKGDIELKIGADNFIECKQTYDGLSFALKHGLEYYLTDPDMQIVTKERIIQTLDKFKNAKKVTVDLFNRANPIRVEFE